MSTQLLEKAFAQAASLPENEQNAIANWIIEEIESEKKWDSAFAASSDVLAQMADEALAEHRSGQARPLDPDSP